MIPRSCRKNKIILRKRTNILRLLLKVLRSDAIINALFDKRGGNAVNTPTAISLLVQNKHSTRSANEGSDAMLIFVIMGGQWMDGFFDEPSVRAVNSPPPSCYKDSIEQVAPAMPRARHEPI